MIKDYKTIIFDCDGVILNSNNIKKDAYYKVALSHYGKESANFLVEYLAKNTGKTREYFFDYFLTHIVPKDQINTSLDELLSEVSLEIHNGLMKCEISQSIFNLRKNLPNSIWMVVSGGVENELKDIFIRRSLFNLFNGGIHGGPKTKDEILRNLHLEKKLEFPVLFLGDSKYDYEAAKKANLDFLFISEWSEFKEYEEFCNNNKISIVNSLGDL